MHKTVSVIGILLWLGLAYIVTAVVERIIMDKIMAKVYAWKPRWRQGGRIIDVHGRIIS